VVDSDLRSITPEWFELLLGPILLDRCDFVAPLYLRHKYDGTITNSIVYPLTRSLYGKEVRQPSAVISGSRAGWLPTISRNRYGTRWWRGSASTSG